MKVTIAGLVVAAVLSAAGAASAADINAAGMTGQEVADWLKRNGYKAELTKDDEGAPMVRSATDGLNFNVYFYDCEGVRCKALQFSAGFDMASPLSAGKINEWNRDKRYLKAYIDDEGDPFVQYDVNVNIGRSYGVLEDDFSVWTSFVSDFATFIGFRD